MINHSLLLLVSGVQNSGAAQLAVLAWGLVQAGQMQAGLERPLQPPTPCLVPGLGSLQQRGLCGHPTWSPGMGPSGCVAR